MKRHIGGSIPTGIPEWGVSEEELPQVCVRPRDAASNEDLKVAKGTKPVAKKSERRAHTVSWEPPGSLLLLAAAGWLTTMGSPELVCSAHL